MRQTARSREFESHPLRLRLAVARLRRDEVRQDERKREIYNMQTYKGIVQKGSKRGTALGFPTINIPLDDANVSGIYAARVKVGEEEYEAAAYADQKRKVLEAHLLDFSRDLYGWNVTIELLKKIREAKKFGNDKVLREAIAHDVTSVREYFAHLL